MIPILVVNEPWPLFAAGCHCHPVSSVGPVVDQFTHRLVAGIPQNCDQPVCPRLVHHWHSFEMRIVNLEPEATDYAEKG